MLSTGIRGWTTVGIPGKELRIATKSGKIIRIWTIAAKVAKIILILSQIRRIA